MAGQEQAATGSRALGHQLPVEKGGEEPPEKVSLLQLALERPSVQWERGERGPRGIQAPKGRLSRAAPLHAKRKDEEGLMAQHMVCRRGGVGMDWAVGGKGQSGRC